MATKKLKKSTEGGNTSVDISASLISDLNVKFGKRVAYNLAETEAPTTIKRWISTGSIQLDYACRNALGGGYPEGRIVEISGPPSIGKSHLAYHVASNIQKMGGIVVYCDTETATQLEKLSRMGIDIKNNFVYVDEHCTEDVFTLIETTILRARELLKNNFDIPICIIYDSIAGSSPKAELEGTYDQNTVGLQARVLSKGFRKIVGVIGANNITMICINQLRDKIGATKYEDPFVTPGGWLN
jgi:recombination protein RecA